MTWFASACTFARRPRTNGLPIKRKITKPMIGVTTISNNQAIDEDGRRLLGTVPSATILIVNSTRYKINGAQAIAFTNTTSQTLVGARQLQRPRSDTAYARSSRRSVSCARRPSIIRDR